MSKHTPGPWKSTRKFEVGPVSTSDDQSSGMLIPIADVFGDNREADIDLIAAAPELLEALKELTDYHSADLTSDFGNEAGRMRKALAAIAKAEGRS